MRSKSNDFFSTILMLIPLVAVPMLAIFGIPEISPVKKSTLNETGLSNGHGSNVPHSEEISFGAASNEIDLGSEAKLSQQSRLNQNKRGFGKMASAKNGSFKEEEWLPPSSALEGWELENEPAKLKPGQNVPELAAANSEKPLERSLENKPVQQASFNLTQPVREPAGAFSQEIQQVKNDTNPFEQTAPSRQKAVAAKEVDEQFRLRAEKLLRRDPVTWSAAVEKLNELGIRDYRLEPGARPNEFLFSCSYSPPQNPRISRRFEAEAADPLQAVIRVLQQVDELNRNK